MKENATFFRGFLKWFYSVIFCKINYEVEKHNEITTVDEAKALKTLRAFVDSSDATSIKDPMLQFAKNAAFYTLTSGLETPHPFCTNC